MQKILQAKNVAYSSWPEIFVNDLRHAFKCGAHPLERKNVDTSLTRPKRESDRAFAGYVRVENLRMSVDNRESETRQHRSLGR